MPRKMLTVVKVAFGFCIIIGVFEETASWTIDLPQVRKYFFEKSLADRERQDVDIQSRDRVVYDNINTHSLHTDYDKYREHYAEDYKYHGYMEQKVHEAVRNGSAYLEGLRRAIEDYTQRLEACRRQNVTANIVQFRPNFLNQTNPNFFKNMTNPNFNLPSMLPSNATFVSQMSTNFTNFMAMSPNFTMFNVSDGLGACMRADLASEHVRRLAELAVWAASELQDKLYAQKYEKHEHEYGKSAHEVERERGFANNVRPEHGYANDLIRERGYATDRLRQHGYGNDVQHEQSYSNDERREQSYSNDGRREYSMNDVNDEHDDALVLRLAWFLDRLAHLTGYDPKPGDFVEQNAARTSTPTPPMLSMVPTLVSTEDLQRLLGCMNGTEGTATERCAFLARSETNPDSYMSRGMPMQIPPSVTRDARPSASETQEYTYSEQDFTDDDMPLSLPQRPAKTKRKRSVQGDPLQNFVQYYVKHKTWVGANQEEKDSSEMSHVNSNVEEERAKSIRKKRFIVKKVKHLKPENPFPDLSSIVKHKLTVHIKKDEKEAKGLKKFFDKLHKPKTELRLVKFKKSKRSIKYSKKKQPRVPLDPQGDISYYVKNKPGRSYNYNPAQAALVRASLEQQFQIGNILVVQKYGSNYNPANRLQFLTGYMEGFADV